LGLRTAAALFVRSKALTSYAPKRYPGRICLFRAEQTLSWPGYQASDDLGWGTFCDDLAVWPIPGDHAGVLRPENVDATQRAITDALRLCRETPDESLRAREAG